MGEKLTNRSAVPARMKGSLVTREAAQGILCET